MMFPLTAPFLRFMTYRKCIFLSLMTVAVALVSCRPTRQFKTTLWTGAEYHSSYDDTTMTPDNTNVLMPYNRFIDPAGTVIRWGNKTLENHSLDCVLLPDEKTLVVEDRFGLAFIDALNYEMVFHLDYSINTEYIGFISTYSGVKVLQDGNTTRIFWGASNIANKKSMLLEASWDGKKASITGGIPFDANGLSVLALPNDIAVSKENDDSFLYTVLNGNNQLVKIRLADKHIVWTASTGMSPFGIALAAGKIYVSNWAGPVTDNLNKKETAGLPYGKAYIDPRTGATLMGTVSVFEQANGKMIKEIEVGLHPNDVINSADEKFIYVANGNSDNISVLRTGDDLIVDSIPVRLAGTENAFIGHSPNAIAIDRSGTTLFVANGMDNAVAVIRLGKTNSSNGQGYAQILGFIPTEAYPSGLALSSKNVLYISNLEGEGARVPANGTYNSHRQEATASAVPVPDHAALNAYTRRVENANMLFRARLTNRLPRSGTAARPVPERIGEPSSIKHVVYIIKENRTYDQVMGDIPEGNGSKALCIYGDSVTPNQHKIAKEFLLMDNYYVSGKSSAEGHQWTDAAIVTDYIEKNVQAWFNSYPHVQTDAMVYNKKGFIWNNALDNGKSVRIYGEACTPVWQGGLKWSEIYQLHVAQKPFAFKNETTISRVAPILSQNYPGYDGAHNIADQLRAEAFIKELQAYEKLPGDQLPQLMILALPADHTAGIREGNPTPAAMVADNDLALGKIIEAISQSRFYDSTAIFVTEDDSQGGWDHVSAYRATGFVVSPYSHTGKKVKTNYNQTCIVRTIEQMLGLPPMNVIDATALPMFECFSGSFDKTPYKSVPNKIPLHQMNKSVASLKGQEKKMALLSAAPEFDHVDGGNDDTLNRILWFAARGKAKYPAKMTISSKKRGKDADDDDDDE